MLGFVGSLFVGEFKTEEWDLEEEGKVGSKCGHWEIHCLCLLTREVTLPGGNRADTVGTESTPVTPGSQPSL